MKKLFSLFSGLLLLSSCLAPSGWAQSINPGTQIPVQLLSQLDTGNAQTGQEFSATLAEPVRLDNGMVWPKGTQVKGKVVEVVSSGRLSRPASITLQLTQIGNFPVETKTEQFDGQSHAGRNVALIGGVAAVGAILGGIAGGGKGALIGTAAGAGAGTAAAAATGKQEIVLHAETPLTFVVAGNTAPEPQASAPAPVPAPESYAATEPQPEQQASDYYEPYGPEQLDNLLAPIALYPDPLLAQVLLAATFPDEIQDAAPWMRVHNPDSVDYQPWDVSVKAVAHYPTVLNMLNDRMDWTTAVGQAYAYQSTDVMGSVQRLRHLAYAQGNLFPTRQQQVVVDRGYIQIVPAQPRVIFVPEYDPGVVYVRRAGLFNFGTGFVIGAWLNYDLDWGTHRVVYNDWNGRGGGWREQSRPYVHVTNVYVNNRYETVNVNRNVVDRHVDYDQVQRYNSVHHDVTYENRARVEATRVRNEPQRTGQQPRPQPVNERVNERDDRGSRAQPAVQPQPARAERPDNARFERPNPAPPNVEQPRPRPVNERANERDDRGSRAQPAVQPQPARAERPDNARFERPNAEQPRPQPANVGANDRENKRGPGARPEQPARIAPAPSQAAAAPPVSHPSAATEPKAEQQKQPGHGAEKQGKDKDKDKK